jgi:hypothetical protein
MKNQAYATLPHVPEFIGWLATQLDSKVFFQHKYTDRRSGAEWSCDSLYGAYGSYAWNHPGNARLAYNPGVTSASNESALNALRNDLLAAGNNDDLMLRASLDIMAWGGVTARNAAWLKANKVGLAAMVHEVAGALIKKDLDAKILRSKSLRFNSGMTKVYALLCPDFVIYDSRVAAALGLLVTRYCQYHGLATVPPALNFPWAAAKESDTAAAPKRRNPSTGTLVFKRLRSGSHHALWNMRASWVLSQLAQHPLCSGSPFRINKTREQTLRSFEQALFSIGYDLSACA